VSEPGWCDLGPIGHHGKATAMWQIGSYDRFVRLREYVPMRVVKRCDVWELKFSFHMKGDLWEQANMELPARVDKRWAGLSSRESFH